VYLYFRRYNPPPQGEYQPMSFGGKQEKGNEKKEENLKEKGRKRNYDEKNLVNGQNKCAKDKNKGKKSTRGIIIHMLQETKKFIFRGGRGWRMWFSDQHIDP
jgi:hypothetical protein